MAKQYIHSNNGSIEVPENPLCVDRIVDLELINRCGIGVDDTNALESNAFLSYTQNVSTPQVFKFWETEKNITPIEKPGFLERLLNLKSAELPKDSIQYFDNLFQYLMLNEFKKPVSTRNFEALPYNGLLTHHGDTELTYVSYAGEVTCITFMEPDILDNDLIYKAIKTARDTARKIKEIEPKVIFAPNAFMRVGYTENKGNNDALNQYIKEFDVEKMPLISKALLKIIEEDGCQKKVSDNVFNKISSKYLIKKMDDLNNFLNNVAGHSSIGTVGYGKYDKTKGYAKRHPVFNCAINLRPQTNYNILPL